MAHTNSQRRRQAPKRDAREQPEQLRRVGRAIIALARARLEAEAQVAHERQQQAEAEPEPTGQSKGEGRP